MEKSFILELVDDIGTSYSGIPKYNIKRIKANKTSCLIEIEDNRESYEVAKKEFYDKLNA